MGMSKDEFRLVRITARDAESLSDDFRSLRELVVSNEDNYPTISKWIDTKVRAGLKTGERVAYVGHLNGAPIASAVVKLGRQSKFCHLRLAEHVRDRSIGELFFCIMAMDVRSIAQEVHFTLPESLWREKHEFFRSFAFTHAARAKKQYRLFEEELICRAPFNDLKRTVIEKLPKLARSFSIGGLSMSPSLVLSISEPYASRVINGEKTIEVRRRFSETWVHSRAVICAESALLGEVTVGGVEVASPDVIWEKYASRIGCTREAYEKYVTASAKIYAVGLEQPTPYCNRLPLVQLGAIAESDLRSPQSYCSGENEKWSKALAVAALLHGSIRTSWSPAAPSVAPAEQLGQLSLL